MKKFLLLFVMLSGMMMQQSVFAAATVSIADGVVTITAVKAGDLKAYLQSADATKLEEISSATTIVFDGKFNKDDLNALKDAGCCTQSTVDMSEAKFVKSNSSSGGNETYLFVSDDQMQNKNEGDHCIVGATKYKSGSTDDTNFSWNVAEYNNGSTLSANENPQRYLTLQEAGDAPHDYNTVILVGGTEYVFHNDQWTPSSQGGGDDNEEYDYTQMKFDYWGSNVEEIITSKYATGMMAGQLCNGCTNLKTLTINSGDFAANPNGSVLGNNINSLETVNIKKDVTSLSANMFNGAGTSNDVQHFETLTFEDGCQIKTLPTGVFKNTGIKNLTIPSSVEEIQGEAFHSCYNLETVTFVNTNKKPLIIKNRAFQNSQNIKDVYVNVKFSERHMICEYNAFDFKSMEGQTDENAEMTTLHFPDDDNSFNYYAGEWKKGLSMRQSDLNAFKDGLNVTCNEQEYIEAPTQSQNQSFYEEVDNSSDGYYHPSDASKKYAPANGWQQFAKTDSEREIFVKGNIYMTYSTDKAYSLPTGIVAFRVTDYKYADTNDKGYTTNGTLILKAIDQVPTETGMLLISTNQYVVTNENVMTVFFFGDPVGTPAQYHYTMGEAGDDTSNYLAPAVHGIGVGPVSDKPDPTTGFVNINAKPFTHRNFAMHKTSHQFVRLTKCTMPDNRAFLSLPITKFNNPDESASEGPTPTQTLAGKDITLYDGYDHPYTTESGAKAALVFDYDVEKYGMIWPLAQNGGVTDGVAEVVSNSNAERVQEGIFTLQGVKVAQPTEKGIYIVNGKKVIIK